MAAESNALEAMTRGTSGTEEIWWPRARSREGTEEAASAEVVAKRLRVEFVNYTYDEKVIDCIVVLETYFCPRLIFWCHFLHTFVGANMRPERH